MKILIISMIREAWGGSEELWYDMAKVALSQNHEVHHVSYDVGATHAKTKELIDAGLVEHKRHTFKANMPVSLKRYFNKIQYYYKKHYSRFFGKLLQHQFDSILYNGTAYSIGEENQFLAVLEKYSQTKFYIIAHLNGEQIVPMKDVTRKRIIRSYARALTVFFVSDRTKQNAERQLGITISNAKIIRNPVNLLDTSYIPYPTSSIPQMAIVGNLVNIHKGHDRLLKALNSVALKDKQWVLNIYGTGMDEPLLKAFTSNNHLSDKIVFHGKVNDIRSIWQNNQILIMPSLMEGMPLALVEAMLCGRTSIVTDVGGNTEWITDEREGFIIAANNVIGITETILKALNKFSEWNNMGSLARSKALSLYDAHAGKTLLNLIRNHD